MQFLWVYIKEAHPSDGSQTQANIDEGIILPSPTTLLQREKYAKQAAAYLNIGFTSVIDEMDDRVEGLYSSWPLRLYLVGQDGRLEYVGRAGPRDYQPVELQWAMNRGLNLEDLTSVSAASFEGGGAPDSIVASFGKALAESTTAADGELASTLAGASLSVMDARSVSRAASLFFVSPTQVNFLLPGETALGGAIVSLRTAAGAELRGPLLVRQVAPGVFTANSDGAGVAAAHVVRTAADGSQTWELVFDHDPATARNVARSIDVGGDGAATLVLYGTGIRHASSVEVSLNGDARPAGYFGDQGQYPGLDQVNVTLPPELAGAGTVIVDLIADGVAANSVRIRVR